ncbi:MAG: phosphate ABC transporter permease subunit PstC, partial [Verrucomicrobiota bacterium]
MPPADFVITKRKVRMLGLTVDDCIKFFFGGNAVVSIIILALITVFLFREGAGFFGQNRQNLQTYRQAGLEYVDFIRTQTDEHSELVRYLADVRLRAVVHYTEKNKLSLDDANAALAPFDEFANGFTDAVEPLRGIVSELGDAATAIKTKFIVNEDKKEERLQLVAVGKAAEAEKVEIVPVDFTSELKAVTGTLPAYQEANRAFTTKLTAVLAKLPALPTPDLQARLERFSVLSRDYLATFPTIERNLSSWDFRKPVALWEAFTAFIFGRQWITASFWQDWYGILPLFFGSLTVSLVALCLAVPFGVGAAFYVNQVATQREQKIIKPGIEFISAFPSVVLGFFGIAVLGETLRLASGSPWLSWLPGFPYAERLNILTAGCLLALIAVPTIFTLAEDAINNVPRAYKEASFALGASRLQTVIKIIVPASLSGIISAVLLGLGRVIGETMVVLLCAGNRIAIPDFTQGFSVIVEPVHTMTGIIAQEMGEVVRGSIHYRALFVVGLVL